MDDDRVLHDQTPNTFQSGGTPSRDTWKRLVHASCLYREPVDLRHRTQLEFNSILVHQLPFNSIDFNGLGCTDCCYLRERKLSKVSHPCQSLCFTALQVQSSSRAMAMASTPVLLSLVNFWFLISISTVCAASRDSIHIRTCQDGTASFSLF